MVDGIKYRALDRWRFGEMRGGSQIVAADHRRRASSDDDRSMAPRPLTQT